MEKHYIELTRLIERLHRRYIDVMKSELVRQGVRDLNGVQALLLTNIGDDEIVIRDLVERGHYLGSNVSYNIRKLTDLGYLEQERAAHDRRAVNVRLTPKAAEVVNGMRALQTKSTTALADRGAGPDEIEKVCDALRTLERTWAETIQYGLE